MPYIVILTSEDVQPPEFVNRYLELRRELFGYEKETPEIAEPLDDGRIHLKPGRRGMVRNGDEAQTLMNRLQNEFPDTVLHVSEVEIRTDAEINW